jgi:hypothetical protein
MDRMETQMEEKFLLEEELKEDINWLFLADKTQK